MVKSHAVCGHSTRDEDEENVEAGWSCCDGTMELFIPGDFEISCCVGNSDFCKGGSASVLVVVIGENISAGDIESWRADGSRQCDDTGKRPLSAFVELGRQRRSLCTTLKHRIAT